jgi:Spy/CpxP family protein refolding chaperone
MNRALQWKLIAGFLLVFIAGGTTGAFFGASHARHLFFEPPRRALMSERMRERLRSQLDLTPEQVAKISPIIDRTAAQLEQVRQETGEHVRQLIDNAHQEIAANLTEAQRAKLKKMETRYRHWHKHRHGFRHWHSPPPEAPESPESL